MTNQVTWIRLTADNGAPVACGNNTRATAPTAARLRCVENGVGIPYSPDPFGWTTAWSGPARGCASTITPCWRVRTRRSTPRSRCRGITVAVDAGHSDAWAPGAVDDGPTADAAVADLMDALEAPAGEIGPPDELTLT